MSQILQKVAPIGEARDREILKDASTYVYQERDEGPVQAHLFFPDHQKFQGPRPLVIFFHGGFWDSPTPSQFVPHCLHFASRGAVAVAAETRTANRDGTGAVEALDDARALVRWLRRNADTFQIDPAKVTVGGAAGGALLALLTVLPKPKNLPPVDGFDCTPQALILFSTLINPETNVLAKDRFPDSKTAKELNPMRLVRRKLPPMLLFHGKSDRTTPFDDVQKFWRKSRWRRNPCQLIDFEKAEHSFFNFNVSHRHFEMTVAAADHFLVEQGLLEAGDGPSFG
ncbi:MAG: alpha/beta hydrolase [Verrucomicrobiales bacterium]|nr:alpha/beta hydrolase [Verrucomicrobiota bacterium JB025]